MSLADYACADEPAHVFAYHADCLAFLRSLPDDWTHAIICDPPYGLADHKPAVVASAITAWASGDRERVPDGRGFMGRDWDAFVPPPAVWDECLRVLKPGGHLAVFAGSRTVDLMGLSIRLAGFELRDSLAAWLYGCLTDDAEILTEHGWRPGVEVARGERVAQWDPDTGAISLAAVQDTFRGPWYGPMRVLRNADTDQVLTPNHRVHHRARRRQMIDGERRCWYDDAWEVAEAGELSTWNPVQLPVAGEHDGPGVGGPDYAALLGWVWTEGGFDHSGTGVRIYQSSVNADHVAEIGALLDRLGPHKRYDRERTYRGRAYVETTWFISGELARQVRADLPGKRPTYDLLWRMTGAEKRALRDAALAGDGHVDRRGTWQFYQRHEDDLEWFATLLALVGQAGKVGMRPAPRTGGAVYVRDRATTELQARHLRDDTEHYRGEVWCVRVPTGAFVARRNGRVFITGNSGFPKSLDVGKALSKQADQGFVQEVKRWLIDRFAESGKTKAEINRECGFTASDYLITGYGADAGGRRTSHLLLPYGEKWARMREVVGFPDTYDARIEEYARIIGKAPVSKAESAGVFGDFAGEVTSYATTDAAREWQGWGTALKPAHEPILLARKPFPPGQTVAANVLAHRAGALNVDACRVGMSDADREAARVPNPKIVGSNNNRASDGRDGETFEPATAGRWPTNVVLAHHPGCGPDEAPGPCVPGCQVAALDEQSGTTTSKAASRGAAEDRLLVVAGASRFFPTFRYQAKAPKTERPIVDGTGHPTVKPLGLMRWLVRLLVPEGGLLIDPFAGSGATLEAARLEDRGAVGVERDEHSVRLIAERLGVPVRTSAHVRIDEVVELAPEPTPTEILLGKAAAAESVDALRALARAAVADGLWCDEVKAAFTARRVALESEAA